MKSLVFMALALAACGGSSKSDSRTTPLSDGSTTDATRDAEVALDEESIELSMERSVARQQALEQARETGTKKEAGDEPLPEPPSGPRTKGAIRAALERRMSSIKRCYEAAIYADQTAQGSAVVTFQITGDGRATIATATGFTDAIHTCLTGEVAKARFPAGNITPVRWALKFSST